MLNILSRRLAYAQSTDCGNHVLHAAVACTKSWRLFDEAGVGLLDGPGRREAAGRHVLGSTPPLNRTTRSRDYREIDLRTRSPVWAIHASNAANAATIAPITTSIVIASLS